MQGSDVGSTWPNMGKRRGRRASRVRRSLGILLAPLSHGVEMVLRRNLEDWERALSVAVGTGLLVRAARRRQAIGALSAVGLIARGVSGFCPVNAAIGRGRRRDDTRLALGGSRGLSVRESITIERAAEDVFDFWKSPDNLPRFMRNVERVELHEGQWHWIVRGPAGVPLEWDAEIINEIDSELIAWRSLPGADVASAGSVHFRPRAMDRTEVTVTLQYDPPGGKTGAMLAWLAGRSPASELRGDLRRLKQLLETGEVSTVIGQPNGQRKAINIAKWADA